MNNDVFDTIDDDEVSIGDIMALSGDIVEDNPLDVLKNLNGEMTLADENKYKDALTSVRKRMALTLDGRKLKQANVIMDSIETNIAIMNDLEVMSRVKDSIQTAMDLKFLTEANEKNFKMLQNLMRLDSVDGQGTSVRIAVAIDTGGGFNF